MDDLVRDALANIVIAVITASLVQFFQGALRLYRQREQEQKIAEQTDTDAVLVRKIAAAVRPSFTTGLILNTVFVSIGIVAGAYNPEIRVFLNRPFNGS